jgi:hypothetical protein
MTLDVLVYSEREAERLVFISGRKYVQGQLVGDRVLLEAITREGALLSYQGERPCRPRRTRPAPRPEPDPVLR